MLHGARVKSRLCVKQMNARNLSVAVDDVIMSILVQVDKTHSVVITGKVDQRRRKWPRLEPRTLFIDPHDLLLFFVGNDDFCSSIIINVSQTHSLVSATD